VSGFRDALLKGAEHRRIGAVSLIAEAGAAIAISRGGARKTYPHTDPNEDAALFVLGEGGVLAAVADGHHGARGAAAALACLRDALPSRWLAAAPRQDWEAEAIEALGLANHAVLAEAAERQLPPAPTTLSLALVRPREGIALLATVGDTLLYSIRKSEAPAIQDHCRSDGDARHRYFLGYEQESAASLREKATVECVPLAGLDAIVIVTDGLSEVGIGVSDPAAATLEVVRESSEATRDRRPAQIARSLTEVALAAQAANQSGDNVACAVILPAT